MSTTGGTEQGTVYVLDEPDAVRKKIKSAVTDSGPRSAAAPDKEGIANLIEILAVVRGIDAGAGRGASSRARATATSRRRSAEAVVEFLAPVRERYAELRADEAALEAIARGRRREGARDRRPGRSPTCATAMGVGRAAGR